MEYLTQRNFGEGIFWFCMLGCTAAAAKHALNPEGVFRELTPVAFKSKEEKPGASAHPAAVWWGGYAFAIMNAGHACQGLYAVWKRNEEGKDGFVLATAVLFALFSATWVTKGAITSHPNRLKQATKIGLFSALFTAGFVARTYKA